MARRAPWRSASRSPATSPPPDPSCAVDPSCVARPDRRARAIAPRRPRAAGGAAHEPPTPLGGRCRRGRVLLLRRLDQRPADRAVEVGLQDRRVDVAAAGDGRGVAEPVGGLPDRLDDVPLRATLAVGRLERPQRAVRQDRAGPRPEVLRGEVGPGRFAEVVVDVVGTDVADLAVVVDVLEELLAGQVLAASDQRPRVGGRAGRPRAAWPDLPRNRKRTDATLDRRVPVAQGRQPERPVEPGVLVVADADQRQLEQADDGRQDLLARQAARGEVVVTAAPDPRQDLGEGEHALELVGCRGAGASGVVAVLLATARVAAASPGGGRSATGRSRRRSRPVGWRAPGSGRGPRGRGSCAVGVAVAEAAPRAAAADAGPRVGRVAQAGVTGDGTRIRGASDSAERRSGICARWRVAEVAPITRAGRSPLSGVASAFRDIDETPLRTRVGRPIPGGPDTAVIPPRPWGELRWDQPRRRDSPAADEPEETPSVGCTACET